MVSIHQAKLEAITSIRHHDNGGKPLQAVLFRLQVKVARNYGNKEESNLNFFSQNCTKSGKINRRYQHLMNTTVRLEAITYRRIL